MDVHFGTTSNRIDSKVKFSEICGLLERIQKKSSNDGKKQIFLDFLNKWRTVNTSSNSPGSSSHACHSENVNQKWNSFYPVMRLLLPKLDTERPSYGIKEHTLAKHYIEILGLGKDSPDAHRLLNYRAPTSGSTSSAANSDSGDFAAVAYHVLQHRLPERGTLSVHDVNTTLDNIALGNISKSRDSVKQGLTKLLRNMGPVESKWMMRIILKEMKVGLSETSIFAVFHPDSEQLFNVTSSLKRVCEDLIDPNKSLGEIEIKLFTPFRPMLADRILVNKVVQMVSSNSFYVETKMDGERVQLHKKGSEFRYFSRSSKDFTSSYGKNDLTGSFTPFIAAAFKKNVDSCVLDGEMMVYSTELQQFVTKGQKVDVKHVGKSVLPHQQNVPNTVTTVNTASDLNNDDVTSERQVVAEDKKQGLLQCYVVFDLLMLNGVVLSAKRLQERLSILKDVFDPIPERLRFVNQEVASTQDEVMSILNTAIDNREEGIIIKHPDSVYKPDKRKDSGWFKIKPDYEQNIMSDLDLLIVGGYYGAGRRSKIISHFLLALADNALPGQDPRNFLTFVKVGSGYSDLELREILKKLNPHWKETKPQNVLCSNERPVVWVEPENSLVISVRAAEMIVSEKYKAGYTLRFPRMEALRDDKKFTSVMNMEEMDNLWKSFQGKLATGYSLGDATLSPSKKRTRVTRKINRPITVDDRFKSIDCSEVTKKSEIFADREICVMPIIVENGGISKSDLETMIVENGGKIVQNPTKDTFCVLTDKVSLRIRNAMRADKCDIVHYSWAQRCVTESQDMVAWRPEDMFYVCKQTRSLFAEQYGENFEEQFRA